MTKVTPKVNYNAAHDGERVHLDKGQEVEIPDALATRLVGAGVVTKAKAKAKPKAKAKA